MNERKFQYPPFSCPRCHAKNILFAGDPAVKNRTTLVVLDEAEPADYVVICPKCKARIGVREAPAGERVPLPGAASA